MLFVRPLALLNKERPRLKIMQKIIKPAAVLLAVHMLILSGPYQSVWAAMISTQSIINLNQEQSPRDVFKSIFAREEIQAVLISHGIDPQEARERIDTLSDDEIAKFVYEIEQLPAGGSLAGVITLSLMFILLMMVDIFYNNPPPNN